MAKRGQESNSRSGSGAGPAGQTPSVTRRSFLKSATAGAALFHIVPRSVLGGQDHTPPSEKLDIACIGVGGMGRHDAGSVGGQNIVAICDVHDRCAARSFEQFPEAKRFRDFRRMLDEVKNLDAVTVSTPDHTHAVIAMRAMRMGKHVYCQKPLTYSVFEARRLTEAAREHGVATQMGNQGQASEHTRRTCELIWDGAIGPVHAVHVWTDRPARGLFDEYWPQGIGRPGDEPPVPDDLDWDLWLGPAPSRPYHKAYHPFRWRGWWDFGTGALGDIGCHALDPVFRALKLGAPSSVQATSTPVNIETYPRASVVQYRFGPRGAITSRTAFDPSGGTDPASGDGSPAGMPPVTLTWYDGGIKPPRPAELDAGGEMGSGGTLYVGAKGVMLGTEIYPESRRREYEPAPQTIPRSIGHYEEWIAACKGGAPAGSNFDVSGPLTEAVLLGNVALRHELRERLTRQILEWDSRNLCVTNLPEANAFLRRPYREGWSL